MGLPHPRREKWVLVLVAFFIVTPAAVAQGKDPGAQQFPPLKVEVSLVSLTATVADKSGKPIIGLKKDDFELYEDSVRQEIAVFHNDETIPVSIGILFDTSGSMVDKIDGVQDAVVHFAETTNPEDDIFLVRFSSSVSLVLDSTSDRQQIKRAVRSLEPFGSTALYDAIVEGLQRLQSSKQKKKALLLVTDGRDTSSQTTLSEAVGTARQSEAIIYALGIGHGEKGVFGHLQGGFEDTVDMDALRQITDPTGGRAVLLEGKHKKNGVDQIDQAALEVSAELRNQYTLGYYPTNKSKDGTFRRLEIRAKNPDYIVRTRTGYLAPKDTRANR
jgi:Ca-activated chloride channel family protein